MNKSIKLKICKISEQTNQNTFERIQLVTSAIFRPVRNSVILYQLVSKNFHDINKLFLNMRECSKIKLINRNE